MKKILFIAVLICGIFANGQEYSGGIEIGTGFKLSDPQPIDDKYVVADSADLHNLPNVYEGLWSYSKADSAIFVYDGFKWGRIGGANGFIELSKAELDAAIGGGYLVAGALYKITGVNPELYGGTDIYLTAISATELNPNGVGKFYNPKYDKDVTGFGIVKDYVWWADLENQKESGEYDVDDVVIWGGKHWVCVQETSISTKYIVDDFELDTDYFEVVPFNDVDYNIAYDGVKYDYGNDLIIERNEKGSNVVSFSYDWLVYFTNVFWGGSVDYNHPIRGFMWGNIYDDAIGIGFQTITNSLNRNINFSGSYQSNLTFNNSYQDNLTFDNSSYQSYLTFDNSGQYNLTFDNNSYQFYLTFNNNSYQDNLTFDNSSQSYLTFDNISGQSYLTFDNSSQSYLTFDNNSSQYNLTFDNSGQYNLTFDNNSSQSFLTATDGYSQQFLYFNNRVVSRTGLPLIDDEVGVTYDNTSQGLKLKGAEVFSITDDEDYIQKKYADDNYIPTSEKGANNGVATLDSGGKVPSTQLPDYLPLSGGTLTGNLTISKSTVDANDRLLLISDLNTTNGRRPFELRSAAASSALRFNTTTATWDWFIGSVGQMRFDRAGQVGVVEIRNDAIASSIYADATGLGVGLSSPTQSLDVVGNARFRAVGEGTFDKLLGITSTGVLTTNMPNLTAIEALSGTSGLLRKTAANTWSLDTNTYATTGDLGDYIPLAGTEVDKPITGLLENVVIDTVAYPAISSNYLIKDENGFELLNIGTGWTEGNEMGIGGAIKMNTAPNDDNREGQLTITPYFLRYEGVGDGSLLTSHSLEISNANNGTGINVYSDGIFGSHEFDKEGERTAFAQIADVEDMIAATTIVIPLDDFTLPAMSSPPNQNSFAPIDIVTGELPEDIIDWEITWTDSGFIYKLSALGDYNAQIRESGGKIQIGGQTRSATDYVVDDTTNEPKLIIYIKSE